MLLLAILLHGLVGAHAAGLRASLDRTRAEPGEALRLTVRADDVDLSRLDLTPLKADFEILDSATTRSEFQGRLKSQMEITLYPLRSGALSVPALSFGKWRSEVLPVEINADSSIAVRAWIVPSQPMERQAATLHLTVSDDGSLEWSRPTQITAPDMHLIDAGETRHDTGGADAPRITREFRWRVLPLRPDSLRIDFPMLDAYKFGARLRFAVAPVTLRARPAPAYLPLYVPIGKPLLHSRPPRDMRVDQPASWVLDIDAPGLSADGVQQLLRLHDSADWRFYPLQATALNDGGQSRLRLTIHLLPLRSGELPLPTLALPYFDLATGQLADLRISAPAIRVRDPARDIAVRVAAGLSGSSLIVWLAYRVLRRWRPHRRKHAWIGALRQARDADALYALLTQHAPLTVRCARDWLGYLKLPLGLVEQLERLRFGTQHADIEWESLKTAWAAHCLSLPARIFVDVRLPEPRQPAISPP